MSPIYTATSVPALFAWALLIVPAAAPAAEPAHQHGVGQLQIALEGEELAINLSVPGADAVGFEHQPKTDADRKAVDAAAHKLEELDHILEVPAAAKCEIESAKVTSGLLEGGGHDDHSGHKHDKEHAHKDEHKDDHGHKDDHKDEHKHDHGHKDDHKDEEPHAEFIAQYHLHCHAPGKLDGLSVKFFKAFPSAHELKAQWITPKGQGAATLTAKATRLTF